MEYFVDARVYVEAHGKVRSIYCPGFISYNWASAAAIAAAMKDSARKGTVLGVDVIIRPI